MRHHHLALIALLLIALCLLSYQINLPYCKILEHGTLEIRARNFLQQGFLTLRFLPTRNLLGGRPNFYLKHPPLFIIILSLWLKTLGDSEISARLLVIICSLGSLTLLYLIIRRETSIKLAIFTTLITILLPIFFYYGRVVNYDPYILFISLLVIWLFLKSSTKSNIYLHIALFIAVCSGVLSDWGFYFTPLSLFIYALIRKQKLLLSLGTIFAAGATFLLMIWYYSFAASEWGGSLTVFEGTGQYIKINSVKNILWLSLPFHKILVTRMLHCFTFLIPLLALGGLIINFINIRNQENRRSLALTILLLFNGLGLIITAPSYIFNHDWGLFMLIPAISFLCAQIILKFPVKIRFMVLLFLIVLSALQFRYFHSTFSLRPFQVGRTINQNSRRGDSILTLRGPPIAYYSGLPVQFLWPGPPGKNIILNFHPTWVVFHENQEVCLQTSLEKFHTCLKEEGYHKTLQSGFEVWKIDN